MYSVPELRVATTELRVATTELREPFLHTFTGTQSFIPLMYISRLLMSFHSIPGNFQGPSIPANTDVLIRSVTSLDSSTYICRAVVYTKLPII